MKKLILITGLLFGILINSNAQIVKQINIADLTTDTIFYFPVEQTKYNTSLGVGIVIDGLVGTGGTYEYLNSYSDSVEIVNSSIVYTITTDTLYAVSDVYIPFSYVGFKITKGSMTAGTITTIIERKTRK